MNEYTLNGQPLSAFGIIPLRASADSNLAISGAWDLPKRTGETFYDWPEGDGVEPYVDADEITFGNRSITFSGLCRGTDSHDLKTKLGDFSDFVGALPAGTVELACKWGSWQVEVNKEAAISAVGYGRRDATVRLSLDEPAPLLSGGTLPPQGEHAGGIDGYSWQSLGLGMTLSDGRYTTPVRKELKVTGDSVHPEDTRGGRNRREITFSGYLSAPGYAGFNNRVKALYSLFGGPGIRHVVSIGATFDCFCTDGFKITALRVKPGITLGLFNIKLIVI